MKRFLVAAILVVLSCSQGFGQMTFEDESSMHPFVDGKLEKLVNKSFSTPPVNDMEFRLRTSYALGMSQTVFVMRCKDKVWEAHCFDRDNDGFWGGRPVASDGLDTLWRRLEGHRVLTLPDQSRIEHLMQQFGTDSTAVLSNYEARQMMIFDGITYSFELAQYGYARRVYSYHCPHARLQRFPNVGELYDAYAIIVLVYKYLGLPLGVC